MAEGFAPNRCRHSNYLLLVAEAYRLDISGPYSSTCRAFVVRSICSVYDLCAVRELIWMKVAMLCAL